MLGHDDGVASFAPGSTIVRRDVFDGRVWSALPGRVLSDDGAALVFGYWPGSEGLVPTSWIDWVRSGDEERRADAFADLAGGQWTLGRWTWQWTNVVHTTAAGQWFSVNSFFSATSGERICWYVNFERPHVRTSQGIDTFDLLLDLVVQPDLTWSWKDEGEFEHGCRIGLISSTEREAVQVAQDEVIGLVETQGGAFAESIDTWRPKATWPTPELPPDADHL